MSLVPQQTQPIIPQPALNALSAIGSLSEDDFRHIADMWHVPAGPSQKLRYVLATARKFSMGLMPEGGRLIRQGVVFAFLQQDQLEAVWSVPFQGMIQKFVQEGRFDE